MTHLDALELHLSHERIRLQTAKTKVERDMREIWISQIEKEISTERAFIAAPVMSDDELLAELQA